MGFLMLLTVFGPLAQAKETKVEDYGVLAPKYFNLATGKKIDATATCGTERPEVFCKLSAGSDYLQDPDETLIRYLGTGTGGQFCDLCNAEEPSKAHPIENAIDGTENWWQSPPLSSNTLEKDFNKVNVTIDLGQVFHVAYIVIKFANSPRAGRWVLERSLDGENFHPWQYFANHGSDCPPNFGIAHTGANDWVSIDDEVRCTSDFSEIPPLENGEIIVSLIKGRPGAVNFWSSPTLQAWTKARKIRLRFELAKTLLGHLMGIMENDESVTRRYFYSIKDISIGGRCDCNGHADECSADKNSGDYKLRCDCKHNTAGISCQECMPLFNQRKWKHAERDHENECVPCNCHQHADRCYYDENVERNGLSVSAEGIYEGGGVCVDCKHHTTGINCERCENGFYRNPAAEIIDVEACLECDCPSNYTDTTCDHDTGACKCKEKYAGHLCNSCAEGFMNFPECDPCPCFYAGTEATQDASGQCRPDDVSGTCSCKENYTGPMCDQCADGFFNFPDCIPCECAQQPGAIKNAPCDKESGACVCKPAFDGDSCEQCATRYHNYPACDRCLCSEYGTTDDFCNSTLTTLSCFCDDRFDGAKCEKCRAGYHTFPDCVECTCSEIGTLKNEPCDIYTGQCACKEEYSGVRCDQCADNFYMDESGFCKACECDLNGAESGYCDKVTGQCECRQKDGLAQTTGRRCDSCALGFFNFPKCESCPCHPDGIANPDKAYCSFFETGTCTCKRATGGMYCEQCLNKHWNLQGTNPDGCEECGCSRAGLLNEIRDCASSDGQCSCKNHVCSRKCSKCLDGFYGLEEKDYFGCVPCSCDVGGTQGGALAQCEANNGQCTCKDHVKGRRCDDVESGWYFPTLYKYKFEAEDGYLDSGEHVRYGVDKALFPGFSLRGYAELSDIQPAVVTHGEIEKPLPNTIPLYKVIMRFVNPTTKLITARLNISDLACVESDDLVVKCCPKTLMNGEQHLLLAESQDCYSCHSFFDDEINEDSSSIVDLIPDIVGDSITFSDSSENSRKKRSTASQEKTCSSKAPQIVEIKLPQSTEPSTATFSTDAVLSESEYKFRLEIDTEGTEFKKEGVLVDYIALLPADYYEPRILKQKVEEPCKFSESIGTKCMMYEHFPLQTGTVVRKYSTYKLPLQGDFEIIPPLVYNTVAGRTQPFEKMLMLDGGENLYAQIDIQTAGKYVIVMDYVNKVERLQEVRIDVLYRKNAIERDDALLFFNAYACNYLFSCRQVGVTRNREVSAIDVDAGPIYLSIRHETRMRDDQMLFIRRIHVIPFEDWSVEVVQPKKLGIFSHGPKFTNADESAYPSTPASATTIQLSDSLWFVPSQNGTKAQVSTELHAEEPSLVVIHYYNVESLSYNTSIFIESAVESFHGTVRIEHCQLTAGCRAIVYLQNGDKVFPFTEQNITLSITFEENSPLRLKNFVVIPETKWSLEQLDLAELNHADSFIKNCGFLIDPSSDDVSETCKNNALTLVMSNSNPRQCQCATAGTVGYSEKCEAYGGQCECKPNVIGRDCSRCEVGYYNWPNCRKCNCVGNTVCDENTGECLCPANTSEDCLSCQNDAYGYHHITGCKLCNCNAEGTVGASESCDDHNGQCACLPFITGKSCDRCFPGYYGFPSCKKCECDERGTIGDNNQCDVKTGACQCKDNVEGTSCSRCKAGSFFLDSQNPAGCISCFCSDLIQPETGHADCRPSDFAVLTVSDMSTAEEWRVQGMISPNYEKALFAFENSITLEVNKAGGQARRSDSQARKPLYWIAPVSKYGGNRLGAYGGFLKYTITWDEEEHDRATNNAFSSLNTDPDLYLDGGGLSIYWKSDKHRSDSSSMTVRVPLMENGFFSALSHQPISRNELLKVLRELTGIKMKASYPVAVSEIQISNLILEDTDFTDQLEMPYSDTSEASRYAHRSRVEVCTCPEGHKGPSCEECEKGYYWEKSNTEGSRYQRCQKCKCNNHCDYCDEDGYPRRWETSSLMGEETLVHFIDSNHTSEISSQYIDGVERDGSELYIQDTPMEVAQSTLEYSTCLDNTAGQNCETCAEGFIGYAKGGTSSDCKRCPCPSEQNSHSISCYHDIKDEKRDDYSEFVDSFSSFSEIFNPEKKDDFKIVCNCQYGYTGPACEKCDAGFFGRPNMINQECKKCDCNGNSDMSTGNVQCDDQDGTCLACVNDTAGKHCEKCAPFFFGNAIEKTCESCTCNICGSQGCDNIFGDCQCKPNVIGETCDQCADGFWDFDSCHITGCKTCACHPDGSLSDVCDKFTGQCTCKPGVEGLACDKCQEGHYDLTSTGCKACDCPAGLPCDSQTGRCECPPGVIGAQCDQCEDPRAVTRSSGLNTRCEACSSCIDWLLGPRETGDWNEFTGYEEKSLDLYTTEISIRLTDLEVTKAGGLAYRRLNIMDKELKSLKNHVNSLESNLYGYSTGDQVREFEKMYNSMLNTCHDVHEYEVRTQVSTDDSKTKFEECTVLSAAVDEMNFRMADIKKTNEIDFDEFDNEWVPTAEEIIYNISNVHFPEVLRLENNEETVIEQELATETLNEVNRRYNVTALSTKGGLLIEDMEEKKMKLDQFKETLDQITEDLSHVLDLTEVNNKTILQILADVKHYTESYYETSKILNAANIMNNETRHDYSILYSDDRLSQFEKDIERLNSDAEIIAGLKQMNERVEKSKAIIAQIGEEERDWVGDAGKHAATIEQIHRDYEKFFNEVSPGLDKQIELLRAQNIDQVIKNSYAEVDSANELLDNISDRLPALVELSEEKSVCNDVDEALLVTGKKLDETQNHLNLLVKEKDPLDAQFAQLDLIYNSPVDSDAYQTLQENMAIFKEINQSTPVDDILSVANEVLADRAKIQITKDFINDYTEEQTKMITNTEETMKACSNKLEAAAASVSEDSFAEVQKEIEVITKDTDDMFAEMQRSIDDIMEQIEMSKTLVNYISNKIPLQIKDDEYTKYDISELKFPVELVNEVNLEILVRPRKPSSHIFTLHESEDTFLTLEILEGKPRVVFKNGAADPVILKSDDEVFRPEKQVWQKIRVRRSVDELVLHVSKLDESSKSSEVFTTFETSGSSFASNTTSLILGALPEPLDGVKSTSTKMELAEVMLNGREIFVWNFDESADDFTRQQQHLNWEQIVQQSPIEETAGCYQFSGQDSWAHLTEETHAKYMVNKDSGTIVFQMKLRATTQADALIFYIGDPLQKDYFLSLELRNGEPVFSYNLGYKAGPNSVRLERPKTDDPYIPTAFGMKPKKVSKTQRESNELTLRIGMVGGVAGLSVKEWNVNKVVSVENDFYIKKKSKNCHGCEFRISNQIHLGGFQTHYGDLSHLSEYVPMFDKRYTGCIGKTAINHKPLDLAPGSSVMKSGILPGCKTPNIQKISFNGNEAIVRKNLKGSLSNFRTVFSFTIQAGYNLRNSVLLRAHNPNGQRFVEFGITPDGDQTSFFVKTNKEAEKFTVSAPIIAEDNIAVSIERKNGEGLFVSINGHEEVFEADELAESENETIELTLGGQKIKGGRVQQEFYGCMTVPFIENLKNEQDVFLATALDGFLCLDKTGNICQGQLRFNECHANVPQSLMSTHVTEMSVDSSSSREKPSSRKINREKCEEFETSIPVVDKFVMKPESFLKFNLRGGEKINRFVLDLEVEIEKDGTIAKLTNDDCSTYVSLVVVNQQPSLYISDGAKITTVDLKKNLPVNKRVHIRVEAKEMSRGKTKFIVSFDKESVNKRVRIAKASISTLFIGESPVKCPSTLDNIEGFSGAVFDVKFDERDMNPKRIQNAPAILSQPGEAGFFAGPRGTAIDFQLTDRLEKFELTLTPMEEKFELVEIFNKEKDAHMEIQVEKDEVVAYIYIAKGVARVAVRNKDCRSQPLQISVEFKNEGSDEQVILKVNDSTKKQTLRDHMTVLDGSVSFKRLSGCVTDFNINEEPVEWNTHPLHIRGDFYSLTCPV